MNLGWLKWSTSKTVIGAAVLAAAHILPDAKNPTAWAEGVGGVFTAFGVRDAIAKNGDGK